MKTHKGITLIELMVTLAVVATILTIGIPAVNTLISSNRMTGYANDLVSAMRYARNSAVDGGEHVTICASNSVQTDCSGNDWNNGWLVFEDLDKNNDLNAGETILRVWSIAANERSGLVFRPDAPPAVRFNSNGENVLETELSFFFEKSGCSSSQARVLTVSIMGRPTVESTACF